MTAPVFVDLFAGGGGASEGIRRATGRAPAVAINHCPAAVEMHRANHPRARHFCATVESVDPVMCMFGSAQQLDGLWASPDCTHFSRAKGSKPRKKEIRDLATVIPVWARRARPRVIFVENVEEFLTWGPLDGHGHPIKERAGEDFAAWVSALRDLGYAVEWRTLVAADYGAPTSRKRLFVIARRDGQPIVWPEPTHGPGRPRPWRTAAECIDWSMPCPSIFLSPEEARAVGVRRPLADATLRRIAAGVVRYVLEAERPYIVGGDVAPSLIQAGYGERRGQAPRVLDLHAPLGTVVAGGPKHALVAAFLARHNGTTAGKRHPGRPIDRPAGTVTARDTHGLAAVHLTKFYGTAIGSGLDQPAPTVTAGAGGGHAGVVAAFLTKYYGTGGQLQAADAPLDTIVSKARFGLVTVSLDGEEYVVSDIGMRMLQPRELARAQGFGDEYVLTGSKAEQIARIGNSVPPPVVEALVAANMRSARRAA